MVIINVNLKEDDEKKYNELSEIRQNEIFQLILKYLSNKNYGFQEEIVNIHTEQNESDKKYGILYDINYEDGLNNKFETLQSCLKDTNKEIKSCHSIDERKELETVRQIYINDLEFLNDLSKLQKIFQNREITLTKGGILEIFFSIIQLKRFHHFSKLLEPYLKVWKENLGDNHSIEAVLKEITKTKFDFFTDEDAILNKWGYKWVLEQFGYDCDLDFIENQMVPIFKKRELDRFEKELENPSKTKNKKLNSTDFSKLSGYDFEHFLADLFKKMGYTVDVTPKSRDQGADIIIRHNNDITAVQVKNYTQSVSNSAIQEVVAAKKYYQANKAMVVTSSFFTPSAIDLAYANDVILWDGDKLKQILTEEHRDI